MDTTLEIKKKNLSAGHKVKPNVVVQGREGLVIKQPVPDAMMMALILPFLLYTFHVFSVFVAYILVIL